jgi:hypothetical protein
VAPEGRLELAKVGSHFLAREEHVRPVAMAESGEKICGSNSADTIVGDFSQQIGEANLVYTVKGNSRSSSDSRWRRP